MKFPIYLSDQGFPNPEHCDARGLLAFGGDLSTKRILSAYRQGIFPWFEPGEPILWWSPDPRMILKPKQFKLTRSLKQSLKKPYQLRIDTAFAEVINACATVEGREQRTWIGEDMRKAYIQLHLLGYAHSFELWWEEKLIGGLYGLSLGRAFFGESMFHHLRDASKMTVYHLCRILANWDFDFIDCQLPTTHLQSLGAELMNRKDFLQALEKTLKYPTRIGTWHASC